MLFNFVFSAYDYSYLMSIGWSPSIFPPLNLKELFQKLEYSAVIDNRCCCCQELVSPLLFHSLSSFYLPGSFFVLLVSFPVWYPILTFFSLQNYPSLTFSLICTFLLPLHISHFSPGVSQLCSFSAFPPLSQFYFPHSPLPSGMQLYLLLCQQILGGADQPTHPLLARGAAGVLQPTNNSQAIRGCPFPPSPPSPACLERRAL